MSIEREIYKRIGKNDWELSKIELLEVGNLFSLHENGKFKGLFKAMSPPYLDKDGECVVQISRYKEGE